MGKFVLIDGNSLINRAFYATPILTDSQGNPTNAVYAFINMLVKIINDVRPDHMLVAFDRKEPTFRHKMFTEYKGTRKPMPEELAAQIPLLKTVLDEMGIKRYEQAGFEADDIIGTLAKKFSEDTIVYTGDKDSFQLVDSTTSVYFTKRGITEIQPYTAYNFVELTGITPVQIIDLKALMGDSSDNIPGVKGVGEKTALSLVQQFGSVENLYENVDEITGKLKDKLVSDKENCLMSKTLATINTQMDIPLELADLTFQYPFSDNVRSLFSKYEFKNLLKKEDIFVANDGAPTSKNNSAELTWLTEEALPIDVLNSKKVAVNIGETVSVYIGNGIEYSFKIRQSFFDEGLDYDGAVVALKPIFSSEDRTVVTYGKKTLLKLLSGYGIQVNCKIDDLMLIKYLTDFSGSEQSLEEVLLVNSYDKKTPAFAIFDLFDKLYANSDENERAVYESVELPLSEVLLDMEREGFKVDVENLKLASVEYKKKCDQLLSKIVALAGEDVNPNSSKQLSEILFVKLGLKHGKKIKTGGFSTDSEILEKISDQHEIIPLILEYRKYAKLLSTYIDGFKPLIGNDGLVHTTYFQAQTATGRLSSRKPNLQNIPIRSDEGREIRKLFSARSADRVLIDADYSQIELRLMAALSGCKAMIDAFNSGADVHAQTAADVFNVPLSEVTPNMRRDAKAVNFGIIYGISDYGLAENLKISPKSAHSYIQNYFEKYPEIKAYMDKNVAFAKENGYAVTIFGRKRYIRELKSSNYNLRLFGERVAMNMPLQGTAADIIKIAMISVWRTLKDRGLRSKLILQVHDELVIDAYIDEKDEVSKILVDCMENAVHLAVPLTVEVKESYNWYDCK